MSGHKYRLILREEYISPEKVENFDTFLEKYEALTTVNEEKKTITLHFNSSKPLEQSWLEKELKDFIVLDFYEVE